MWFASSVFAGAVVKSRVRYPKKRMSDRIILCIQRHDGDRADPLPGRTWGNFLAA